MKRILGLALLCVAGTAYISATHEKVSDLIEVAKAIKGKEVTFPASFSEKAHDYFANELFMLAHHKLAAAKHVGPIEKRALGDIAGELAALGARIKLLPAMSHKMKFDDPAMMLRHKAKKAEFMGEKLTIIGEQLGMPKLVEKGNEMKKWSHDLENALMTAHCPRQDKMEVEGHDYYQQDYQNDEGQDECGYEGSDECPNEGQDDQTDEGEDYDMEEGSDNYNEGEDYGVIEGEEYTEDVEGQDEYGYEGEDQPAAPAATETEEEEYEEEEEEELPAAEPKK